MTITAHRRTRIRRVPRVQPQQLNSKIPTLQFVLTWFEVLGYTVSSEIDEIILHDRLVQALKNINPDVPLTCSIAIAIEQVNAIAHQDLLQGNEQFHQWLTQGMSISYRINRETTTVRVWLIDRQHLLNNDWLIVQSTTDLIVLINGLPLALIRGILSAVSLQEMYAQFQTDKHQAASCLAYNMMVVITDGQQARVGTLTSSWQEFLPWLTIDGEETPVTATTELDVLIQGIFDRRRFLELVQYFIWFEPRENTTHKAISNARLCSTLHQNSPLS